MSTSAKQVREEKRQTFRLLKLVSKASRKGWPYVRDDQKIILTCGAVSNTLPLDALKKAQSAGYVEVSDDKLKILRAGLAFLQDALVPSDTPAMQTGRQKSSAKPVQFNSGESPLMRLYCRKGKDGRGYLSDAAFRAGERFRADFERGGLQPRITARYEKSLSGPTNGNSAAELSDFAVDARARFSRAVELLGPDLSGVTTDICCFLKGFEMVEKERQWPPRSAKLMLRTALSILANHYGFNVRAQIRPGQRYAWASEDYRPTMHVEECK